MVSVTYSSQIFVSLLLFLNNSLKMQKPFIEFQDRSRKEAKGSIRPAGYSLPTPGLVGETDKYLYCYSSVISFIIMGAGRRGM